MSALAPDRICATTGFGLVAADQRTGWRITKDAYVKTSGIIGVLVNDRVGPLPAGTPDRRGRYDTLGRTVYFADTAKTALAEVLQHLRVEVMSLTKDAVAIGMDVEAYRHQLTRDFHDRGLPGPGDTSPVADDQQLVPGRPPSGRLVGAHRLPGHLECTVGQDGRLAHPTDTWPHLRRRPGTHHPTRAGHS